MKYNLLTTALVAILGLAFIGAPVQAQTTATPPATSESSKTTKTPYKGTITAINATSVTVQAASGPLTLAIAPDTKILKYKKPATVADFAVGDAVTGSYVKDASGALTAHSLHKKTAAPAAN